MTNPEKIKQTLLSEIERMNRHREDFCKRPGIDFTRDRKITFDKLLHFQISMESGYIILGQTMRNVMPISTDIFVKIRKKQKANDLTK